MSRRSSLIVLIAFALAGGAYYFSRRTSVVLPPERQYSALPAQFRAALLQARAEARAHPSVERIEKLARLYQANRLFGEAATVYKDLGSGLSPEDHYDLALLSLDEGDLPRAARELEAVERGAPDYKRAQSTLAEVWFKLGKSAEAETVYRKILVAKPDDPAAELGLARIELQRNDDEKAAARLENLLAKHPEQTDGIALLSQLWARRGNAERAAALAKWSRQRPAPVEDDPWREHLLQSCYNIQTLSLEFENYANAGQLAKALPLLDRVEALDPQNWIPDLLRGWSQAQAHHLDEAIASYQRALDKKGDKEKIVPIMTAALVEKGAEAEALKLCAEASSELPDSMPILTAYESLVSKSSDKSTDAQLLKRMIAKEPFTYSTNLKLSKIYWETGRYPEALPYLKQIADLYPADVTSRALLGQYYVSIDQAALAIPYIEQALAHEKEGRVRPQLQALLGSAYVNAASALSSAGKYEEAGEAAEKAADVLSNDVRPISVAAENFAAAKNYRHAETALQKLISLQPDNPTLYLSLGDVEAEAGESTKAQEHWQMALERLPANDTELRAELKSRLGRAGAEEMQSIKR